MTPPWNLAWGGFFYLLIHGIIYVIRRKGRGSANQSRRRLRILDKHVLAR
nr:MAG TPA: hypothetical protein [Caudoviricetes sp.]